MILNKPSGNLSKTKAEQLIKASFEVGGADRLATTSRISRIDGFSSSQSKYFTCHQANQRILKKVGSRLKIIESQIPKIINCVGNTGASSVPTLLDELSTGGKLKANSTLVFLSLELATLG